MNYGSFDLAALSDRIIAARKAAGRSQEDVAAKLGISRPTYIAIEKATRRAKPEELVKLAEFFEIPLNRLLRSESRPVELRPHLRSMLDAGSDQDGLAAAITKLTAYIEDFQYLRGLMGDEPRISFPPVARIPSGPIERFAEHCAGEARTRLDLGAHQPVYTLRKVLEGAGMNIFVEALDSKLAGLFVFVPDFGYCILVNRLHPWERRRWTIAHEYGHFVADRDRPGVDYSRPMQRKPESERFADAFAAAFLMPETGVQRRFYEQIERSGDFTVADLCQMADYFAVSLMAMSLRLEAVGLIAKGSWDGIVGTGASVTSLKRGAGIGEGEQDDSVDPYPLSYKYLAVEAFGEEKISEGELAKLLRCSRIEARNIVEQCASFDSEEISHAAIPLPLARSLLEVAR